MQTVTLTPDMAQVIASAIREDIKGYIDAHREEFEAWLKARQAAGGAST